jgi:serine protease Do
VRGWLGVAIQEVTPQIAKALGFKKPQGALVSEVSPESPAEKAGIKRGDIILEYDGHPIKVMNDLPRLVAATTVGKKAQIKVWREGKIKTLDITIGELKEEVTMKQEETPATYDLGIEVIEITPYMASQLGIDRGVMVNNVKPASPAYEAGLRRGDVILEINKKPILETEDYYKIIKETKPEETLLFLVKRKEVNLYIALAIPKGE